jgi:hypothetical protein
VRRKLQGIRIHHVALVTLTILSGCNVLRGFCSTYDLRNVSANGSFTEAGAELVTAQVNVIEFRDHANVASFNYQIISPALKGHVSSVALVSSADPTQVILQLRLLGPDGPILSQDDIAQPSGTGSPDLAGFFDLVGTNRAVVRITRDSPAGSFVLIPLTTSQQADWHQQPCD